MVQSWTARTKMVRSEKGFTLVELLATIVILGIIAAIAVPSIGKLMDNSKKDAHVANAEQIIEAARLKVASDSISGTTTLTLSDLVNDGYMENVPKNPGNDGVYDEGATEVFYKVTKDSRTYSIKLFGEKNIFGKTILEKDLNRSKVKNIK